MTGTNTTGTNGMVSSEDNRKIIAVFNDPQQFSKDELVTFHPPRHGEWTVTEISEDQKTITVQPYVNVEMLEQQTSSMSMLSPRLERERSRVVDDTFTPPGATSAKAYASFDLSDSDEEGGLGDLSGGIVAPQPPRKRGRNENETRATKHARDYQDDSD